MKTTSEIDIAQRQVRAALVGNPNTGKTTLFNALTGYRQRVGNYPGVTVEKKTGVLRTADSQFSVQLIDLPGAYSIAANSTDEAVVLDVLLGRSLYAAPPDVIVVVVDATNLGRNLFLTSQVLEIGRPVVVALNMVDLAESSGLRIDAEALAEELACPVVPVVATKGVGVSRLSLAIVDAVGRHPSRNCASFPACVCAELQGLTGSVEATGTDGNGSPSRVELLQTLLDPGGYHESKLAQCCGPRLAEELSLRRRRIEEAGESLVEVEARVRYAWIERLQERVVRRVCPPRVSKSEKMDCVLTHRVYGLLFFVLLMGMCFQSIYAWAAPAMDGIDRGFSALGDFLTTVMPAGALRSLLNDGAIAGAGAVLTFLPQILILFLFLAVLEDCGYMARAAFLVDRWMGMLGLGGKSFIPLLSSFACAVPGIMATRTIENRRDRFVTILIAPLMSCSARLPVYILMIGAFIPATPLWGGVMNLQAVVLLAMYALGAVVAVAIAFVLKHTFFKGVPQPFLMELPTYKWPSARTVLYRMYEQGREFVVSAGTIIFAVALVVWALGYYPRPASIAREFEAQRSAVQQEMGGYWTAANDPTGRATDAGTEADARRWARLADLDRRESGAYLRQSLLGRMGHWIEPFVKPLGWDWRIGMAAIASFPAREVVIATMGTIYNLGEESNEASLPLHEKLHAATWDDGRPVFNVAVALSIMVFFSLCCQCGATLAVIRRETRSWRWPIMTFTYMTVLAYGGALVTYQVAIRFVQV